MIWSLPKEQVEARQEQDGPIAILDTGRRDLHAEDHPQGIHEQVALAPADLLARIVADGLATLLGAFDALAVEDGRSGRGLASFGDADLHPQTLVELLPQATLAPGREVIEHRGLGRKVLWQHTPLTAASIDVEDRVEDHSSGVADGSPARLGLGNEWLEDVPFVVGQIAGIGLGWVHPKLDV